MDLVQRLTKLERDARARGHFALAAAARCAAQGPDDLDHQINVVGAMHECGRLRNSLRPYWKRWRENEEPWLARCVERASTRDLDCDYWALAAMLGCQAASCHEALRQRQFHAYSLYSYTDMREPRSRIYVACYAAQPAPFGSRLLFAPYIELGFDAQTFEVLDASRWRAASWEDVGLRGGALVGERSGSHCLSAQLPYGARRLPHDTRRIDAKSVVPPDERPAWLGKLVEWTPLRPEL